MASVVVVPMALQAFSVSAFDKSKIRAHRWPNPMLRASTQHSRQSHTISLIP